MGEIVVGTSSWADPGFVDAWYPKGLPARQRLAWYAERFDAVEVNSTFYAVPDPATVQRWADETPARFRFDWKLHRLLSRHAATPDALPRDLQALARTGGPRGRVVLDERLQRALIEHTLEAAAPLGRKLTAFLLQLSPAFKPGAHALEELDGLADALRAPGLAIELRHRGWVDPERLEGTLAWYERVGVTFVAVDAPRTRAPTAMPPVDAVTRRQLAYLRAHGRNAEGYTRGRTVAERFGYRYSDAELRELIGRAQETAQEAEAVHVMFNNNRGDDAPAAAARMRELLG